ncbi:hypothetical protein HanRHA438_Chr14g0678181 [Helianthus annuus]|nr:hypothetical protein HanRHA438_Chr14g0678181 [Helianthus annuus]
MKNKERKKKSKITLLILLDCMFVRTEDIHTMIQPIYRHILRAILHVVANRGANEPSYSSFT